MSTGKPLHDPQDLRQAFGTFMTGVTVVTALDARGQPAGFTANSFTSVSLEPPLLLVCPGKAMRMFEVFNSCEHFAVNILSEQQQALSDTFAVNQGDRFAGIDWQADAQGCPLLNGVVASFSCSTYQRLDAGDHIILLGHVDHFQVQGGRGLGFSSKGYFTLDAVQAEAPAPGAQPWPVRC
ncbi:MAG: flavin reductase family protein [Thiolinea sp.]